MNKLVLVIAVCLSTSCALVMPKSPLPDETKYRKAYNLCEKEIDPCKCFDSVMRIKPKRFVNRSSLMH